MPKFVIFKDVAGEYRWRLVAGNGEIVAASEGYTSRFSAERSARRVKEIAGLAVVVNPTAVSLLIRKLSEL
jgi:uncharacterized protein YegP (UPF0339 family)